MKIGNFCDDQIGMIKPIINFRTFHRFRFYTGYSAVVNDSILVNYKTTTDHKIIQHTVNSEVYTGPCKLFSDSVPNYFSHVDNRTVIIVDHERRCMDV